MGTCLTKEDIVLKFSPTVLEERIDTLDILRGFSLLGIILVNVIAFYSPLPYIDLASWFTVPSDIIWQQRLDIYVQSSFYPLFSILFGYGLAMQYMKAQRTGANFYTIGSRRLVILLLFGLLHAFLLWWGDILISYAFCGLILILFLRLKPVFLIIIAFAFNLFFHFFMLFIVGYISMQEMEAIPLDIMSIQSARIAYGTGSWIDAFFQRVQDVFTQYNPFMWVVSIFTILPYMLLGAVAGKLRLVERAKQLKVYWVVSGIIFFAIGIVIKSAPIMLSRTYLLDYLKVYVGGPILSLGYIGIIVSLCYFPIVTKILRPFAKVGRMSITLYLMQSLVLSILFYNFGLGLYGNVDVFTGILIAIVVFIGQAIFAEVWLSKFKQGPIEAIWRKFTYGKLLS